MKIFQERVQKIINENTSPDFEGHAKKKKERIDARIKRYNNIMAEFTPHQILQAQAEVGFVYVYGLSDSILFYMLMVMVDF